MKQYLSTTSTWKSRILLAICLIIAFFMIRSTWTLVGRGDAAKEAEMRVKELEKEQAELLRTKEEVDSPVFAEREAREKLGLAKPGEVVIVLPAEDILRKLAPEPDREMHQEVKPIYRRWQALFF